MSQGPAQRLRAGVVAEVTAGDVGERQLLNTTEEGLSGCVVYSRLVLEDIKTHSKQMNPVRLEMVRPGFYKVRTRLEEGQGLCNLSLLVLQWFFHSVTPKHSHSMSITKDIFFLAEFEERDFFIFVQYF